MVLGVAVGLAAGGAITGTRELTFAADRSDEDRTHGTANIIKATASEASMMARCTGKTNLQNVEPEDLRALTVATATATGIPARRDEVAARGSDPMGRIVVDTRITNLFDEDKSIRCEMLVDTGAGALILPAAWKERFGAFKRSETVSLQLANQDVLEGEACWPVEIEIEGFRPVSNEVIFVEMEGQRRGQAMNRFSATSSWSRRRQPWTL